MNIAIVIAVSKYSGAGNDLPGCDFDGISMNQLLSGTTKFADVLFLSGTVESSVAKARVIQFISQYKDKSIEEIVFYFSGHGRFTGTQLYYLLSDHDDNRMNQTTITNAELDNWLRALSPKLTVKIVDACYSGIQYVKEDESYSKYLNSSKSEFKACYFFFSSQSDQRSYQSSSSSVFTQAIVRAVANHQAETVRYKDVMDYVADSFRQDQAQKPLFIVQGDFTEVFCEISDQLRNSLASTLKHRPATALAAHLEESNSQPTLTDLVRKEAGLYCTADEASAILISMLGRIKDYIHPGEATDLFNIDVTTIESLERTPNTRAIGQWIDQNKGNYFAEPLRRMEWWDAVTGTRSVIQFDDHRRLTAIHMETVYGFRSTVELPYTSVLIHAIPKYPNLMFATHVIVPIVSKTHVRFFTSNAILTENGWENQSMPSDLTYTTSEIELKDSVSFSAFLEKAFGGFWKSVLDPLRKRFGLESDSVDKSNKRASTIPPRGAKLPATR